MPMTLQSRARRMQVFHLPHDVFCHDRCACEPVTSFIVAENPRTGERARKQLSKRVPGSITFLAREQKRGLPTALLQVAEVKAAIDRGYLRVVEHTVEAAMGPASPAMPADPMPPSSAPPASAASSLAASVASTPPAPPPAASATAPPMKAPGKEA